MASLSPILAQDDIQEHTFWQEKLMVTQYGYSAA